MGRHPLTEPASSAARTGAAHGEAQLANRLLQGLQRHKSFCYEGTQIFLGLLGWGRAGGKEEAVSK